MASLRQRLLAEAIGSALLFATVVGSGIMAERLAGGNVAVALLGNTIATAAMLYVLITMFAPISGAHFNPAVSAIMAWRNQLTIREAVSYTLVQTASGIVGVWIAHAMFDMPIFELSTHTRAGVGQWLGEGVATFGLIVTILGTARHRPASVPMSVALYIAAGYWFTSSTSFANPAITIARSLSNSFAGIAPSGVPMFIAAQMTGAILGAATALALFRDDGDAGPA